MSAINGSVILLILAIIGFSAYAIHAYLTEGQPTMYTDADHQKNREAAARYGTEYAQRRPGLDDPLSGEYADDLTPTALVKALGIDPDTITHDDLEDLCDYFEDAYNDADNVCLCPTWTEPFEYDGPADYASACKNQPCPAHPDN